MNWGVWAWLSSFHLGEKVAALLWEQGGACLSPRPHLWAQMADGQWGGWSSACCCQLCAAPGDLPWTAPTAGGLSLLTVHNDSDFHIGCSGHGWWVVLRTLRENPPLQPGQNLAWCFCQRAGEKQSPARLWNSLFGGFVIIIVIKLIECFLFAFFTGISVLNWRNISHKHCNYSVLIYFCSNVQSDEVSLFWWRITYLETRIPIISTNREWWHRKLCHEVTQELHIRGKDKLEWLWWKVIKIFSECILQIFYLFQTFQWPDSSFIFYQEK